MTMISEPAPRAEPYSNGGRPTSSDSPEGQLAAIERAVADAVQDGPDHRRTLQQAVAEYTLQMKKAGEYPEKVLVAVKSTVANVVMPLIRKSNLDDLVRDAAQWSIAAYFETKIEEGQLLPNRA